MEEKYIWPLVGVFLGWIFTTLSTNFKNRFEKKKLVGNLLTKLIRVERQLGILISATDKMKDYTENWHDYEPIRQGVVERHFLEPDAVRADLKQAIDDVAPLYPILAIDLENMYELLLKNKKASLLASSSNEKAYIRMLSIYEVGLDFCKINLSKTIYSIALKHGLITYLNLKYVNFVRNRNNKNSTEFANNISSEIMQELKSNINKSSKQQDANEEGASA